MARGSQIILAISRIAVVSPDETLAFYDLRDYAKAARARLGADGLRAKRAEALADSGRPRSVG